MKPKPYRNSTGCSRFLLAGFLLAAANSAYAQSTYFWDADGDTTTDTGGSGTWDAGSSLWRSGSSTGTLSQWPNIDPAIDTAQLAGTAGTLTLNSDSVNLNVNKITFATTGYEITAPGSGTATVNLSGSAPKIDTGTSVSATISAPISGSTGLTKTGSGTLTLSGNNSYTGVTTVASSSTNGGIVNVSGDQSAADGGWNIVGLSTVNFQSGSKTSVGAGKNITLANSSSAGAHSLNVAGTVTSAGGLVVRGRSTLNLNSGADWTQNGPLTIQPLNTGYGGTMNVKTGASFTYNGSSDITLAKSTSGANGSATLVLSGGTFTTAKGFSNTNAGTGAGSTNLNFSNGGTLKLSNDIASLIIQGSTPFNVSTTNAAGGIIDTNGFSTSIDVAVSGAGGLTKDGDGTLTLSGGNTYGGSTLVSAGALLVNGSLSSTSAVTVDPLAAIGGTGLIGGNLTVAANSSFRVVDVNDPLDVGGTTTFGSGFGIANLLGIEWDSLDLNTPYTLISTTQTFGTGDIANFGLANAVDVGNTDRQAYFTTGSLAVVVIPEPGAALLGGLGLLALLRRRRTA